MTKIILASQSPRRSELLKQMGLDFVVRPSNYDEHLDENRATDQVAPELALGKALDVAREHPDAFVIGADSIVALGRRQLGKPKSLDEARQMLTDLAGRESRVVTGVALLNLKKNIRDVRVSQTKVYFKPDSPAIARLRETYLKTGDWRDKAGAYGIQSGADALIDRIDGDRNTIIGLPTDLLRDMLARVGQLNTPPRIKAVIADSDGTLVDTVNLIRHGQYQTAKQFYIDNGVPLADIPNYDTYAAFLNQVVGGSAQHTLKATAEKIFVGRPDIINRMDFTKLRDQLNQVQDQLAKTHIRPYQGLSDFLQNIGKLNLKLAIFTSGTAHHVIRNLGVALPELKLEQLYRNQSKNDQEKLAAFIAATKAHFHLNDFTVVTAEDAARHKPDPESLDIAMRRLGVPPQETVVVGDHAVDMQAARAADIPNRIGVTHGFHDEQQLLKAGATKTADSLASVTIMLKSLSG
jgi:septum formation protein